MFTLVSLYTHVRGWAQIEYWQRCFLKHANYFRWALIFPVNEGLLLFSFCLVAGGGGSLGACIRDTVVCNFFVLSVPWKRNKNSCKIDATWTSFQQLQAILLWKQNVSQIWRMITFFCVLQPARSIRLFFSKLFKRDLMLIDTKNVSSSSKIIKTKIKWLSFPSLLNIYWK